MKKILTMLSLSTLVFNCSAELTIKSSKVCCLPTKIIQNRFLRFTLVPSANGRISSLVFKEKNYDILLNYSESRRQEDPLLPEMVFGNSGGLKEWLWQKKWKNIPNSEMTVTNIYTGAKQASISMFSQEYMSSPIQMTKTCSLKKNSLNIGIDIALKNTSSREQIFSLWINSIPKTEPKRDYSIIPVAGNTPFVGKRNVLTAKKDEINIFRCNKSAGFFIAAGAPWNARYVAKINALMLIAASKLSDVRPGGMFYTWHGRIGNSEIVTQEIIFPLLKLTSQESRKFHLKLMIFPNMKKINALIGNTAIYAVRKKQKIIFEMNSTVPAPPRTLKITWKNADRKFSVPGMQPGKCIKFSIQLPKNSKAPFKYFLNGQKIHIIPEKK